MTWRQRLERARLVIWVAAGWRIALLMISLVLATLIVATLVDSVIGLPRIVRALVPWFALGLIIAGALPLAWRMRHVLSDQAVALWIERHYPLDYLLVTGTDPRVLEDPAVTRALDAAEFRPAVRRAAARAVRGVTVFTAGLFLVMLVLPAASFDRVTVARAGDALLRPLPPGASRLAMLVVQYTPPVYIGGETETIEDPESVRGIEGGRLVISGRGSPAGITSTHGAAESSGDLWQLVLAMPSSPAVVRFEAGADARLLALEPIRDSLPRVTLQAPARDTVVRVASGRIELEAQLSDDFGVSEAWFEYVVSSGSGELFQFRSGRIGSREQRAGSRTDSIQGSVGLDTLRLQPGDVMHLRAVARDRGPARRGAGASETRTYRVARPTDLDTAQVIALPALPGDTAALSERLLIVMTEGLEARRPRLRREVLLEESRSISRDQARLRRQVADVIFMRLSGEATAEEVEGAEADDSPMTPEQILAAAEAATGQGDTAALDFAEEESPVVAINRPLLEAYNAMWDATRELDHAALTGALPHMYRALDAIQRARAAERIYLRAPAQRAIVNLEQVRLTGRREGIVVERRMSGLADERIVWLERLLETANPLIPAEVRRDSLLVLRVDLLSDFPAAAAALNEAIAAMKSGVDPNPALNRARRVLAHPPIRPSAHPPASWGGAW